MNQLSDNRRLKIKTQAFCDVGTIYTQHPFGMRKLESLALAVVFSFFLSFNAFNVHSAPETHLIIHHPLLQAASIMDHICDGKLR